MNKFPGDLSEKERELLMIRRASGAKASQLAQMEKMLQETKSMLDKKTEMGTEKITCGDNMGLYHSSLCVGLMVIYLLNIYELSLIFILSQYWNTVSDCVC